MKRIYSVVLAILFICCLLVNVSAAQPNVVDRADLLTPEEESILQDSIDAFVASKKLDLVILTVDSLEGKSAADYADDYYDNNGYGIGEDFSGLLILISMDQRDWAVSTCGEAIDKLSDSDIDAIMDAVLPYLSAGFYYDAFNCFISEVDNSILTAFENFYTSFLIALVIGCIVGGISILIMRGGMNTARAQSGATSYSDRGLQLTSQRDIFLFSQVSRSEIPKNNSTSTHTSSSGRSHGGRSGKF